MPTLSTKNNIVLTMHSRQALPYPMDALEPILSKTAVKQHYDFHYANYVDKLNEAYRVNGINNRLMSILRNYKKYPKEFAENGGGYINHTIFFHTLKPPSKHNDIPEHLKMLFIRDFGSSKNFLHQFIQAGKSVFGSGWVWWCMGNDGQTYISTTKNQDTPYMFGHYPIFGIDLWEHSYYLDYFGDREKYLKSVCTIINWNFVIDRIKNKINNYV
jgi:Fe-Mn family superoxide dismutase